MFKIEDRQSEKKRRNGDRRVIGNATCGIDAGRGVIRYRGVSDGAIPPGRKYILLRHQDASILKCRMWTYGGRHRLAEIVKDKNVLIEVEATL